MSVEKPRTVRAGHGNDAAMGYWFRCRIETRNRRSWLGFTPTIEYRWVLERCFIDWTDERYGSWNSSKSAVEQDASKLLDSIERKPVQVNGTAYYLGEQK